MLTGVAIGLATVCPWAGIRGRGAKVGTLAVVVAPKVGTGPRVIGARGVGLEKVGREGMEDAKGVRGAAGLIGANAGVGKFDIVDSCFLSLYTSLPYKLFGTSYLINYLEPSS